MKKFKVISTCASILLMLALMAFGVYAASQPVTIGVSGKVTFTVSEVFIKVSAGLGDTLPTTPEYYYSVPASGQNDLKDLTTLPNGSFSDEKTDGDVLYYYLYVENLHGMAINVRFALDWKGTSKYNSSSTTAGQGAVTVEATEYDNYSATSQTPKSLNITNNTPTISSGERTDTATSDSQNLSFAVGEKKLFVVKLTLKEDAMLYKLSNCSLKLNLKAAINEITNMGEETA